MRRPLHVLRWVSHCQNAAGPSGSGNAAAVERSRRLIRLNSEKQLPEWALAFSTRSAALQKPKDESTLHSIDIAWQGGGLHEASQMDDPLQVLMEWKALQTRLSGGIQSEERMAIEQNSPPSLPLPSSFFDSNNTREKTAASESVPRTPGATAGRIATAQAAAASEKVPRVEEVATSVGVAGTDGAARTIDENRGRIRGVKTTSVPLWIVGLNYGVLGEAMRETMKGIRSGDRNLDVLAGRFMRKLERMESQRATAESVRALRLQEIQLFFFAQWIARISRALSTGTVKAPTVYLFLDLTLDLYQSISKRKRDVEWITGPVYSNLRAVQRATLHRLFSVVYPYTRATSKHPAIPFKALFIVARLLGDVRLRPAQLRYLCRKFLLRLEGLTMAKLENEGYSHLWEQATRSFVLLIREGIVLPYDGNTCTEATDVDVFLRLLCTAMDKRQVSRRWGRQAVLDVVGASQSANLKRLTSAGVDWKKGRYGSTSVNARHNHVLSILPFVTSATMEEVSRLLARSGEYELLRRIAFMAPREHRTLAVLTQLMRKWSNVSPDLTFASMQERRQRVRPRISAWNCKTSLCIWAEAIPLLELKDRSQLLRVFSARMASHARSRAPGMVIADIKAMQGALEQQGKHLSLIEVLGQLNDKTQAEAVRAFTRAGRLRAGMAWGRRMLTAAGESGGGADGDGSSRADGRSGKSDDHRDRLGLRLLNVLLSAFFRWRGRGAVRARRRLAALVRRGVALKANNRVHLRRGINRHLRNAKRALLESGTRSIKDRSLQFSQATRFLQSFTQDYNVQPNHQTSVILLLAILRLSPLKVSDEILTRFKHQMDWDWQSKGVSGVLTEIQTLLAGGGQLVSTASNARAAHMATLVDAGIYRRRAGVYVPAAKRAQKGGRGSRGGLRRPSRVE